MFGSLQPHRLQHARLPCLPISLLKFMSIESVMLSNCLIFCHSLFLLPSVLSNISSFPVSQLFTSGGESIGTSASASVLPMNIQSWFPLGLTGLNSMLSKGLTKVSPAPQFESINSSAFSLLYGPTLTSRDITLPKKERRYFANKGPSNQSYSFSSSHVWMWELDRKEAWALKNWCFRTVVLEKTLESPWAAKR